jgi:hypothetical protein
VSAPDDEPGTRADFISPIDGHDHYKMAERDTCAICCLQDDRDRLVEALEGMKDTVSGATHREVVADRDRLRKAMTGAVLAIETVLTEDHVDMGVPAGVVLGRTSAALKKALGDRLDVAEEATDG